MREPNAFKKWKHFAVNMTFSLRKGIPTSHASYVKKKRGLFSVPIPPCRSLVALPRNLPLKKTSFWNINQIPFRGTGFCKQNPHSRAFAFHLGATHPCPIAVHTEPFSTSVFKGYTWIVATSTKIFTRHRSTSAHAGNASTLDVHASLL
jgi:hypothetical protein